MSSGRCLAAILAELEPQDDALDGAAPKRKRNKRNGAGRQPLPVELPRIEHRHEPASCECGACGKGMVLIGEDISEQLDVEPARFFVHRHIRPQYACRACERVTAAPIPPAIIDGGMAAPGLLAWVAVSKYTDHLPLYRIEQIGARQGVPLARSTLAEWIGKVARGPPRRRDTNPACHRQAERPGAAALADRDAREAGWLAPTVRSIPCCRSRSLYSRRQIIQVDGLDAYFGKARQSRQRAVVSPQRE
jgi:transposase